MPDRSREEQLEGELNICIMDGLAEIFKRAAMNFGTCRGKRGCSRIRAGQAEHLMICSEEFLNDRRAEPSSGASD